MSRTVEVVGAVVSVAMAPGSVGVDNPGNVDTQAHKQMDARNQVVVTRGTDTSFGDVLAKHELSFGVSNNQPNGGRLDILPSLGTDYSSAFKAANRVYVDPDSLLSQQYLSANPDLTNYLRQGNSEPEVEPSEEFISQPVSEDVRQEVLSQLPESFMFTVIKEDGTTELIQYNPSELNIYTTEIPEEYILVDPDTFEIVGICSDRYETGNILFIPFYVPESERSTFLIPFSVVSSSLYQDPDRMVNGLDEALSLVANQFRGVKPYSEVLASDLASFQNLYRLLTQDLEWLNHSEEMHNVSTSDVSVRGWLGHVINAPLPEAFLGEYPESTADYFNAALRLLIQNKLKINLSSAEALLQSDEPIRILVPTIDGVKEANLRHGVRLVFASTRTAHHMQEMALLGDLNYNAMPPHVVVTENEQVVVIFATTMPVHPISTGSFFTNAFTLLSLDTLPRHTIPPKDPEFYDIFGARTFPYATTDTIPSLLRAVTSSREGSPTTSYYSRWQKQE